MAAAGCARSTRSNVPTDTASSTSIKRNNRLERTGLFREFVELQPSEPQILGFANKFGVLTDGQDLTVATDFGRTLVHG